MKGAHWFWQKDLLSRHRFSLHEINYNLPPLDYSYIDRDSLRMLHQKGLLNRSIETVRLPDNVDAKDYNTEFFRLMVNTAYTSSAKMGGSR